LKTAPPIRPAAAMAGAVAAVAVPVDARPARPPGPRRPAPPGRPAVDPRIVARRIAVRRAEGQRRLRRLLWIGGGVTSVAVLLGLTRTPLLDLDRLEVTGTGDPAVAATLSTAGIRPGRPLADLDLAAGERALEALPQVASADLRRRWPGTLEVDVEPRVPVASVAVAGGNALVAADGVVVAVAAGPAPLVRIDAPPTLVAGDRLESTDLVTVAASLPEALRPQVAGIVSGDGAGSAELLLTDGTVVRLGAVDQLDDKLPAVVTVLTQVDRSCIAVVDVRVPSVPTVTRSARC
jgi:cell division protein FtsQ